MTAGGHDPGASSFLAELNELQNYAAQFQSMVSTARNAAPPRASGHDSTGLASAEIDSDGVPTTLRLERGWSSALDASQLGAALTEAYQKATQSHLEAWGDDLRRQGWQYDAREFDEKVAATPERGEALFRAPVSFGEPRRPEALLRAVIEELDASHDMATRPPAPPKAAATPQSRVSVTITNGALASIHIDGEWAEGKDAAIINSELAGALQTARLNQDTAAQTSAHGEHVARLDDLLGEVMKALQNHRREK